MSAASRAVEVFAGRGGLGSVVHPVPSPSGAPVPPVAFPHVTFSRVLLVVGVCLVAYGVGCVREAWANRQAQRVANAQALRQHRANRRAERLLDAQELRWHRSGGYGGTPSRSWWWSLLRWLLGRRPGGRW